MTPAQKRAYDFLAANGGTAQFSDISKAGLSKAVTSLEYAGIVRWNRKSETALAASATIIKVQAVHTSNIKRS